MRMQIPLMALLLVATTTLLARIAVQGIEPALVSMAVEWWVKGVRAAVKIFGKSNQPE